MKHIILIPNTIFRIIGSIFIALSQFIQSIFKNLQRLIKSFVALLESPLGLTKNPLTIAIVSAGISLGILLLFWILQPFGLSHTQVALGFGSIVFGVTLLGNFVVPFFAKNFYNEMRWTIGKQVIHFGIVALLLGASLGGYAAVKNVANFNGVILMAFGLLLGMILGLFISSLQASRQKTKFEKKAAVISQNLSKMCLPKPQSNLLALLFGIGNQGLSLLPNQLIYAEISEHSTDFYYQNFHGVEMKTIQDSMQNIEKEFAMYPQFIRTGPHHFVNVIALQKVRGNARGFQLKLAKIETELAVLGKYSEIFSKAME